MIGRNSFETLNEIKRWKSSDLQDQELIDELNCKDENELIESFASSLKFGTGGLRGILGVGTNKLNIYTIAQATQGLCNYIKKFFKKEDQKVCISRDTRKNSLKFAETASIVFAYNGIHVFFSNDVTPVPFLSYATRKLGCCFGIMITASHNPSHYNGYKVYDSFGCQITDKVASLIYDEIKNVDVLNAYVCKNFNFCVKTEMIKLIEMKLVEEYIKEVRRCSFEEIKIDPSLKIVYTPLNGAGNLFVKKALADSGISNFFMVKEQEKPDENFTTCKSPNPENHAALELGVEYLKKTNSDLLLATDPDCDRVGVVVKDKDNSVVYLNGNEVGTLLFNFICEYKKETKTMPFKPIAFKTIVTTPLAELIALEYNVQMVSLLTGFKYIGESINLLEKRGQLDRFIFGFEESCGYLSGTHVRDKDGVNGVLLVCKMFTYYKKQNITLVDKLNLIYKKYGYCVTKLDSFNYGHNANNYNIIFKRLKEKDLSLFPVLITDVKDYSNGINNLPKSNVLEFIGPYFSFIIRPSGTEPKIKVYYNSIDGAKDIAETNIAKMRSFFLECIENKQAI